MRRYLLSYSFLFKQYYLDYGCFERDRENLGNLNPEQLVNKLKSSLLLHKKTLIYGEISLDNSIKKILSDGFKQTHVKVEFIKDLSSLCKDKPKI